ncbi:hypothetical protein NDU88_003298 [Pleurodeles waltl]|uniref:Uncharacterized protein n=1 Tax=Pleurodeles waltl TaxID=8319 RepID=A0AAV7V237_PLEWA|nr:hypothetical protein NDU88_003298 [Pleurodeles waltl]
MPSGASSRPAKGLQAAASGAEPPQRRVTRPPLEPEGEGRALRSYLYLGGGSSAVPRVSNRPGHRPPFPPCRGDGTGDRRPHHQQSRADGCPYLPALPAIEKALSGTAEAPWKTEERGPSR